MRKKIVVFCRISAGDFQYLRKLILLQSVRIFDFVEKGESKEKMKFETTFLLLILFFIIHLKEIQSFNNDELELKLVHIVSKKL